MGILISGCTNSVNKEVKIGSIDSFSRLFPLDYSLFREYESGSDTLRVQYKPIQSVFFIKHNSQPARVIRTKKMLSFDIFDKQTIFGIGEDSIYFFNITGNTPRTLALNNTFEHNNHTYIHFTGVKDFYRLALNNKRTKLYLPTYLRESNYWKKDFFENAALITEIDLITGKKVVLDYIQYPKEYLENFYGEDYDFNYTVNHDDELVISFQALTNLFVYDLKKNAFKKQVKLHTFLAPKPPFDEKYLKDISVAIRYNFNTTSYYNISYNPLSKHYFRMCLSPTKNEKRKEEGDSYSSKFDYWLFVYDENFNEVWKYNFGDNLNPSNYYLSRGKISIRSNKPSQTHEYFQNISIN